MAGLPPLEEPVPLRRLCAPFLTLPRLLPLRSQTSARARGPGGGPGLEPEARGGERGVWAGGAVGGGGSPQPEGRARRPARVRVARLLGAPGAAFGDWVPRGASGSSGARGVGGLRCSSRAPAAAEFGGERACAPGGGGVGTGAFWSLIFSQVEESRTEN